MLNAAACAIFECGDNKSVRNLLTNGHRKIWKQHGKAPVSFNLSRYVAAVLWTASDYICLQAARKDDDSILFSFLCKKSSNFYREIYSITSPNS